jgi:uncharacterized repeat protein (TIGR03809 family)
LRSTLQDFSGAIRLIAAGIMDDKQRIRATEDIARQWRALAERRREHFADLYDSGRWRKYYREQSFLAQMRETARMSEAWDRVTRSDAPQPAKTGAKTSDVSRPVRTDPF